MQGPNNYGGVLGYFISHLEMLQLNSDNVRSVEASSVHGFQRPCAYEARHSRLAAIFRDDWDVVSRLLRGFANDFSLDTAHTHMDRICIMTIYSR